MVRTITTGAIGIIVAGAIALVSLLSMTASTWAQDAERPYPKMLPIVSFSLVKRMGTATILHDDRRTALLRYRSEMRCS